MSLLLVSYPVEVFKKARDIYGDDVNIQISKNKNKKYALFNPNTGKFIHFGDLSYEDYTKHRDEKRRANYLKRNARFRDADKYTAGYASYHLLW